jgi:type I restriction enzyme R subunit
LQEFFNFVLDQYVRAGVDELDDEKLPQLISLKYHTVADAKVILGNTAAIRDVFVGFQTVIYRK